jgi:ArsR family metal-binding transcriptional regulator
VRIETYKKKFFRAPGFESFHCVVKLDQDVSKILPYLNSVHRGLSFGIDPPSLTLMSQGKIITVKSKEIVINDLKDEEEVTIIIDWLKREINTIWKNRNQIELNYRSPPKPGAFAILEFLPGTDCKACGYPTCMVFALLVAECAIEAEDCPALDRVGRQKLSEYLDRFR